MTTTLTQLNKDGPRKEAIREQLKQITAGPMEPELSYEEVAEYEADEGGTYILPENVLDLVEDLTETEQETVEYKTGWIARLAMPGCLDATDWIGVYDEPEDAVKELEEVYGE